MKTIQKISFFILTIYLFLSLGIYTSNTFAQNVTSPSISSTEITYYVQIAAFHHGSPGDYDELFDIGELYVEDDQTGLKRVVIGYYSDEQQAKQILQKVLALGYTEAFVSRRLKDDAIMIVDQPVSSSASTPINTNSSIINHPHQNNFSIPNTPPIIKTYSTTGNSELIPPTEQLPKEEAYIIRLGTYYHEKDAPYIGVASHFGNILVDEAFGKKTFLLGKYDTKTQVEQVVQQLHKAGFYTSSIYRIKQTSLPPIPTVIIPSQQVITDHISPTKPSTNNIATNNSRNTSTDLSSYTPPSNPSTTPQSFNTSTPQALSPSTPQSFSPSTPQSFSPSTPPQSPNSSIPQQPLSPSTSQSLNNPSIPKSPNPSISHYQSFDAHFTKENFLIFNVGIYDPASKTKGDPIAKDMNKKLEGKRISSHLNYLLNNMGINNSDISNFYAISTFSISPKHTGYIIRQGGSFLSATNDIVLYVYDNTQQKFIAHEILSTVERNTNTVKEIKTLISDLDNDGILDLLTYYKESFYGSDGQLNDQKDAQAKVWKNGQFVNAAIDQKEELIKLLRLY